MITILNIVGTILTFKYGNKSLRWRIWTPSTSDMYKVPVMSLIKNVHIKRTPRLPSEINRYHCQVYSDNILGFEHRGGVVGPGEDARQRGAQRGLVPPLLTTPGRQVPLSRHFGGPGDTKNLHHLLLNLVILIKYS